MRNEIGSNRVGERREELYSKVVVKRIISVHRVTLPMS